VIAAPRGKEAVSWTEYTPVIPYMCCGFWRVEVLPSPKFQSHPEGEPDE